MKSGKKPNLENYSVFLETLFRCESTDMDMKVHGQLMPLLRTVKQLCDGLDDTIMEAGAESYVNALSYYNSVKQAAKMNVPGAKAIYDDLQKRFERKSKKTEPVV